MKKRRIILVVVTVLLFGLSIPQFFSDNEWVDFFGSCSLALGVFLFLLLVYKKFRRPFRVDAEYM